MRKSLLFLGVVGMAVGSVVMTGCGRKQKKDTYDKEGKLEVTVRNLYFSDYAGGDRYLKEVEDKFGLSFKLSSYDWSNWQTQTNGNINADDMTDVFHANIDSYNFAQLYKFWAEDELAKPLPDDLSKWPNIKNLIDNTSNIDSLKLNGKLYGIPIAKNTTDYSTSFSPFTYVYRRDWAKKWGVYQENDEYTWEQFEALLAKFKDKLPEGQFPIADVEWGYPSMTNFYKQVPHCYAQDASGKYINNYTTDDYIKGLEKSKSFMSKGWYHPDQNSSADGQMNIKYYSNQVGVFYENLSYSNYITLRKQLRATNASVNNFNLDDASAIMKIKAPSDSMHADKYVLEGTDNWFSMTFFDYKISDAKQEKILDLLDWLLSEEGTRFAVYGFENYDYIMVDGKPQIQEEYWPMDTDGQRARKDNGAKYLRYLVSLGYDTLEYDPLSDQSVVKYLNDWEAEMKTALSQNKLDVLKETAEVMWLTSEKKALNSGDMRTSALKNVMKYTYGQIKTIDEFKKNFGNIWTLVLKEINDALGK